MLKKSYLLMGSALVFALPLASFIHAQDAAAEPAEVAPVEAPPAPVEVSEDELVELLGYFTSLSGGVSTLNLDEAGVAAFASGLVKGLNEGTSMEDLPQDTAQAAFGEAQARAEAVQAGGEDELPAISEESLQIIGTAVYVQSGLAQLGFGADHAERIRKGFIAGASVTEPSAEIQAKMPAFQEFIQARVEKAQAMMAAEAAKAGEVNREAGKVFIETLKGENDTVQSTDSGLHYAVIEEGEGEKPEMSDSVLVHYKGTRIDGTVFDSSYDRGEPATFPLNGVVPGFGEGLTKIAAGGKITLYIPSDLGYGDSPRPGGAIQAGDTLIFECELIEINPGQ